MIRFYGAFDVGLGSWKRPEEIVRKGRYEMTDGASTSGPSQEKEAPTEPTTSRAQFSDCPRYRRLSQPSCPIHPTHWLIGSPINPRGDLADYLLACAFHTSGD